MVIIKKEIMEQLSKVLSLSEVAHFRFTLFANY